MAFCKYCGNQLIDGELCTCERVKATQAALDKQVEDQANIKVPVHVQTQTQTQAQAGEFVDKSKNVVKNVFGKIIAIWKKPAEEGIIFTNTQNYIYAIIFIAIQAVLAGFFGIAQLNKIGSAVKKLTSGFAGLMGPKASNIELPYGQTFFYMLLATILLSALFFGVFYIMLRLMKIIVKPKHLLCFVSLGSVASIPFVAVAIIITFINQGAGIVLFAISSLFSIAYMMQSAKVFTGEDENKKTYLVAITFAIVTIILLVFGYSKLSGVLEDSLSSVYDITNLF